MGRSQDRMLANQGVNARGEQAPWATVPVLITLTPDTASLAAGQLALALFGAKFAPTSIAVIDGEEMVTTYTGPTDLNVAIYGPLGPPRTVAVVVRDEGYDSNPLNLTLTA